MKEYLSLRMPMPGHHEPRVLAAFRPRSSKSAFTWNSENVGSIRPLRHPMVGKKLIPDVGQLVAALAAVASLAPTAQAQSTMVTARMKVPFAFQYGTKHLPAGTYIITLGQDSVLTVSGWAGTACVLADVNYDPGLVYAIQVVFNKYGDHYFLEELTIDGSGAQIPIPESETERQMATEQAMNRRAPSGTAIARLGGRSTR